MHRAQLDACASTAAAACACSVPSAQAASVSASRQASGAAAATAAACCPASRCDPVRGPLVLSSYRTIPSTFLARTARRDRRQPDRTSQTSLPDSSCQRPLSRTRNTAQSARRSIHATRRNLFNASPDALARPRELSRRRGLVLFQQPPGLSQRQLLSVVTPEPKAIARHRARPARSRAPCEAARQSARSRDRLVSATCRAGNSSGKGSIRRSTRTRST